jgi:hypothetical protein
MKGVERVVCIAAPPKVWSPFNHGPALYWSIMCCSGVFMVSIVGVMPVACTWSMAASKALYRPGVQSLG